MKTKLITALRTAATALENGTFAYDWTKMASCNTGIIACTLTHKSIKQVDAEIQAERLKTVVWTDKKPKSDFGPSWREAVQSHCPITGMSSISILRTLQEAGLTPQDICELEDLSNPVVAKRAGFKAWGELTQGDKQKLPVGTFAVTAPNPWWKRALGLPKNHVQEKTLPIRNQKEFTILYMRAWADILTEQGRDDAPEEHHQPTVTETPNEVQAGPSA